ncbi:nidogen and EGF-like domain-containing 1 isoform X2, partial [Brachionus plicatilis]
MPSLDDGFSPQITLEIPFIFFQDNYTTLYVGYNGQITLKDDIDGLWNGEFPNTFSIIIAPFMTDINIQRNGSIYYRVLNEADKGYLFFLSELVVSYGGESPNFLAKEGLIVTYYNVANYYPWFSSQTTNTFQVILLSDGKTSYALFYYEDLNWQDSTVVGFNSGFGNYVLLPGSTTADVLNLVNTSNVGLNGAWIYKVSSFNRNLNDNNTDETNFSNTTTVKKVVLFPYGANFGDIELPAQDNGLSVEIPLEFPFIFFQDNYTSLFVGYNGLIVLKDGPNADFEDPFPNEEAIVIAPFMADINIERNGSIYYRILNETDKGFLFLLSELAISYSDEDPDFLAKEALIVTYDNVAPLSGASSLVNTFQAILLSDGQTSYVLFFYQDLNWQESTRVGFISGYEKFSTFISRSVFFLPGSSTQDVLNLVNNSNVRLNGAWIYKVSSMYTNETIIDMLPNSDLFKTSLIQSTYKEKHSKQFISKKEQELTSHPASTYSASSDDLKLGSKTGSATLIKQTTKSIMESVTFEIKTSMSTILSVSDDSPKLVSTYVSGSFEEIPSIPTKFSETEVEHKSFSTIGSSSIMEETSMSTILSVSDDSPKLLSTYVSALFEEISSIPTKFSETE